MKGTPRIRPRMLPGVCPRIIAALLALGWAFGWNAAAHAAPEYWVDNAWIRVTGEETRHEGGKTRLALSADCKRQGAPEFIVTHLDGQGEAALTAKVGKYCARAGETVTFLLPLPDSGAAGSRGCPIPWRS